MKAIILAMLLMICYAVGHAKPMFGINHDFVWTEDAEKLRFLGSPSIRINDLDVDKSARKSTDYGIMCRVYITESGMSGYPPVNTIREAIREANKE
jgi:hypothetical protein